jgi:hypothetical protein
MVQLQRITPRLRKFICIPIYKMNFLSGYHCKANFNAIRTAMVLNYCVWTLLSKFTSCGFYWVILIQ